MKKNEIAIFSSIHATISSLILIVLFSYFMSAFDFGSNQILESIVFFTMFFLILIMVRVLSFGKIEIELTESGFHHQWIKKFLFSKEADLVLNWQEIEDYKMGGWSLYEFFQLNLSNNRKYRIYRWSQFRVKDDYGKFIKDFQSHWMLRKN